MKIQQVKELENGVSGITIEGRIIKTPKPPGDSEYGWSQMIILKDDTGEIGSWVNIESAEDAYKVGQYIKVQGKVSKYVKGGKPGVSLNNGKVLEEIVKDEDVSQEKPLEQSKPTQKEYTNNDYWHDKTLREIGNNKCIVRECAIKASTELMVAKYINKEEDYFELADKIVAYIYKDQKITIDDLVKKFGGTAEEEPKTKEERIEKAENTDLATMPQKDKIYGNVTCEKCGTRIYGFKCPKCKNADNIHIVTKGFIHSHLLTKNDFKNDMKPILLPDKLTKIDAMIIWDWWLGNKEVEGERAKREKAEEAKPTKAEKIEQARNIVKTGLELRKGQHGLLDDEEEIDNEDIPGSSPNNAIDYRDLPE